MQGNRSCDAADSCFWKKWYCWGVGEINLKGGFDVCNATINPIVDGRSMVEVNAKFGSFGYVRGFAPCWLSGGGVKMVIAVTLLSSCWCMGIAKREATRTCVRRGNYIALLVVYLFLCPKWI